MKISNLIVLFLFIALAVSSRVRVKSSTTMPGYNKASVVQHFGYINVNQKYGVEYFFWMFESQNKPSTDPFVLWLTGGPGCSSELAIFFENGPFQVLSNLSLIDNPYSWNKNANVLYVDQPGGTGFSYVKNSLGYVKNELQVSEDMFTFLTLFFQKFQQYSKLPFFITGESYGGHYVPSISGYIQGLYEEKKTNIRISGIAVGNGLTDPLLQTESYCSFASYYKLIDDSVLKKCNDQFSECAKDINKGNYGKAFLTCNNVFEIVLEANPGINYYDIRKKCNPAPLCYNFTAIGDYMNSPSTRQYLGVGDRTWETCSTKPYIHLEDDFERSVRFNLPKILAANITTFFYNGMDDLICNYFGTSALLDSMNWPGRTSFLNARNVTWSVNGNSAGTVRSGSGLTFIEVANAGHMVPHDQPAAALNMLDHLLNGTPFQQN
eukprot:TRINITY_DN1379_c0_g1_i1.p1 TRINITY_DN1379_c0_g1~~TRINITY_DN1379_c0_g1_i1.p1  ORF type:complete len:447 (+),score=140.76 TRINITY_DN1379_c0_g1_i1:34-1341(+)